MVRVRTYGSDVPFMAWCRTEPGLQPLKSDRGWVQTDVDTYVHRYQTPVGRAVQAQMEIEVKTRGGKAEWSQLDTLGKKHVGFKEKEWWKDQLIYYFGVSVLRISGETPRDSEWMTWHRFRNWRLEEVARVDFSEMLELIRLDRHPDTLSRIDWRSYGEGTPVDGCGLGGG